MAIIIQTKKPHEFVEKLKNLVQGGEITTWICDSDGDFTLSNEMWKDKAWFHPRFEEDGSLIFNIWGRKDSNMSKLTYAVYHGRMVKLILKKLDEDCSMISVTSLAHKYDHIEAMAKLKQAPQDEHESI